ncbi:MAG: NADH-quinone oxidoreductase subunit M [Candidatus Eremiobacteraeota bacterium]|nr:NADH-quinone oxidoreductase subunit M [Candidatus Eremiobacteraeota bacterium]
MLSLIVFLPLLGALVVLAMPSGNRAALRLTTIGFMVADWIVTIILLFSFDTSASGYQFVQDVPWLPSLGIHYHLGIDGLSAILLFLTALLSWIAILSTWNAVHVRVKEYMIAFLLLELGMLGVFCALDFLLFYVFWEVVLVPMYIIIGVWGGPRKIYATIKFFLFTFIGSLLMLVAILSMYLEHASLTGVRTLDVTQLSANYPFTFQLAVFLAFFSAFAVKVPLWPLHTWLPDAHVEAPTAGSVILAGVLLKLGGYGFLRFSLPLLPDATKFMAPILITLATIAIVYGALVSLVQRDWKKLVAYSSVSHMGFVVLGIFVLNQQGMEGAILEMFNHGIITGALFLCVGIVYERIHDRELAHLGGIAHYMPIYAAFFLLFVLASVGLPGLAGFVGEFLVMLGTFGVSSLAGWISMLSIIIAAGYLLWMYARVMFVKLNTEHYAAELKDLRAYEVVYLLPLAVIVIWLGMYPDTLLSFLHPAVTHILAQAAGSGALAAK